MVLIGKDVFNTIPESSTERHWWIDLSSKYGEFYMDGGEEMYMGDFTGDDVFPDITDLMKFAGIDEDRWSEYDLLDDVKIYRRFFKEFNQADKDKWLKVAEEVGHPEQVIFTLGWNSKTQSKYSWKDFDY